MLPHSAAASSTPIGEKPWPDLSRQAAALAASLRSVAADQRSETLAACSAYANIADEISRWALAGGSSLPSSRLPPSLPPDKLQAFGRLLRDKRNQAGFSRVELARKAKLSDATIKLIESAKHPPSRGTLLRLVGIAELGLSWADTPGYCAEAVPAGLEGANATPLGAALHRFDSRLTLPLVLELMVILDEVRTAQSVVEITSHGARRACGLCEARSEAWAVDAGAAARLPLRHALPCIGRLADLLCQRHPVIAELAQEERRTLRTAIALDLDASRRATKPERFYGCRSGREVAALLTRLAALSPTPHRKGASEMLLWALALGPCPVEPVTGKFSETRAQQILISVRDADRGSARDESREQGVTAAAVWLLDAEAAEPGESLPDCTEAAPLASEAVNQG